MLAAPHATTRFEIAVEDRFIVVKLTINDALLPEGHALEIIADSLASLQPEYTILCDFTKFTDYATGESNVTSDAADVVRLLVDAGGSILCTPRTVDLAKRYFGSRSRILSVRTARLPVHYAPVDLTPFEHAIDDVWQDPPSREEYEYLNNALFSIGEFDSYEAFVRYLYPPRAGFPGHELLTARRALETVVRANAQNSLLTEFAIQASPTDIVLTPYHSHAVYTLETQRTLLTAQPAALASRTRSLLSTEIAQLESLLRRDGVKESEIQRFLEHHPSILKALGYRDIFSQVVLRRDDGTSLRPDFILRPAGNDWCDILDIKLPKPLSVVGGRDRLSLAHGLHELGSQLREYGRYFENEAYAKRVEDVLGVKCYRPTLVGLIGRDLRHADERQLRAAMTTYDNTKILTFDELLRVAKSHILI